MPSENTEHRKLAAIMFTDIVGYSAMSQRNEALALELLEEHRRIVRGLLPQHGGREVKTTGDGFLLEFPSALAAVQAGLEIQKAFHERNQSNPPERQLRLRIGIHLGDVVMREGDIHGDGVNIAARLEPLAPAGGICLSGPVHDQVANKIEVPLIRLGTPQLKNIGMPVEVYRLVLPWEDKDSSSVGTKALGRGRTKTLTVAVLIAVALILIVISGWLYRQSGTAPVAKTAASEPRAGISQSVAVIPFTTMSADREKDEYLSDGLTEHLTTVLSQVNGLRVPARTSATIFKGKGEDVRKIGEQLHVAFVLEGSVQRAGNKLRITVQLINAANDSHLWATNYDREMAELFDLQSEVAQQVVAALKLQLLPEEKSQLAKKPAATVEAYDLYLQGRYAQGKLTEAGLTNSLHYFEQAIQKQPDFALAYAGLSDSYRMLTPNYRAPLEVMPKAKEKALQAIELDRNLSEAHAALGVIYFYFDWDSAKAEAEFQTALKLNQNNANAHHQYALYLAVMKHPKDALKEIRRAQALDPVALDVGGDFEWILFLDGQFDQVIQHARKTLEREPNFATSHANLGMALAQTGAFTEALAELLKARELDGGPTSVLSLAAGYALAGKRSEAEQLIEEMKTLSKQRYVCAYEIATGYALLGDKKQAFDWFDKGLKERCDCLVYPDVEPFFKDLRADPRFAELLRNVGLTK